jgi:tRNA-2-methylthio-N6-dimethylallyladenosine synthase
MLSTTESSTNSATVFIKTYGCQMNVSDSELIRSILTESGYTMTDDEREAKVVLLNTCAIRDAAEQKVWGKVHALQRLPSTSGGKRTIGILGCMAERLKEKLLDSALVQVVAGVVSALCCRSLLSSLIGFDSSRSQLENVPLQCKCLYSSCVVFLRV